MKTLRKFRQGISIFLLAIFSSILFTKCKTLISSTVVSTEPILGTEVKTGKKVYSYETIKNPTMEDPLIQLIFLESEQYEVNTKENLKQVYNMKSRQLFWGFTIVTPLAVGGGLIGSAINNIDAQVIGLGAIGGFLVGCLLAALIVDEDKTKTIFKHNYSYKFKYLPSEPLLNTPINVTNSSLSNIRDILQEDEIKITTSKFLSIPDMTILYKTDQNGYLSFNPVRDFNILNSTNNDPIFFHFNLKDESYIFKPLALNPSLWMNKYSRISVPECTIRSALYTSSPKLGTARKGMEYRILSEQGNQFKIELFNKTGWINSNCTETFYSVPKKQDITSAIKYYVEDKINSWQQQGEFESPEKYSQRMSARDNKINEVTLEAMDLFQQDYIGLFEWNKSQISRYDPNQQTFSIQIPDLQEIIIQVPIDKAPLFKESWESVIFNNQKFVLIDGVWELSSLELKNSAMNYAVKYDSKITNVYDPTNQFAFNLEPITVSLPNETYPDNENSDIIDNYSINTNLPNTEMSNPDAIAVVIGNSNYLYTDPVNFAINDAQLMKVYLTNVLGFKPGNIIFMKNATKGQLEGIFGSNENFKARLNDYVKPDISDVFVYYSGHGSPGINDKNAYFVPVDCDPLRVELQGYSLDLLYKNLSQIPAKSTTVILDACFSGAGVIKNISSIRIKPKEITQQIKNSVITTSSTGDELSSWYYSKQHGLFTYFFLKAIHDYKKSDKNNDNKLTYQEIFDYISDNSDGVPYYARRLNRVDQHPTIQGTNKESIFVTFKKSNE